MSGDEIAGDLVAEEHEASGHHDGVGGVGVAEEARGPAPEAHDDEDRAEDEELARQLQQQMIFEEEFNEQQLLYQQQQQMSQQQAGAAYAPNYPGYAQASGAGAGGAGHPSLYRPAEWGADARPAAAAEESYSSVGDALHAAGSSMYEKGMSWWTWATGDDEPAARKRREDDDEMHGAHEMQPIRRVRGPRAADEEDEERERELGSGEYVLTAGSSDVHSGGGGEVRRRSARHAAAQGD